MYRLLQHRLLVSRLSCLELFITLIILVCQVSLSAQSDECIDAVSPISIGTDCESALIEGTTQFFTNSPFNSSCPGNEGDDGWYWINTSGLTVGDVVNVSAQGNDFIYTNLVMSVVTTDASCSSFNEIDCVNENGINGGEFIDFVFTDPSLFYMIHLHNRFNDWAEFDLCVYSYNIGGDDGSDCDGATVLCSDGAVTYNPTGAGDNDFFDPDNIEGCLTIEHLSAWYYFEINDSTAPGSTLSFDLIPAGGASEDYDFAIYGPDVECGELGAPIRCSYAEFGSPFPSPGSTGLGQGASDTSEDPSGNGYVSELIVNPGEGYFLLVDNFNATSNPFTLNFGGTASLECDTDPPCGITTNAGTDDTGCSNSNSVTLTGSAIGALGGENYTWTVSPASATSWIVSPSSPTTVINIPAGATIGDYTFTLEVTEGTCTNSDNVVIMVEECCSAEAGIVTGAAQSICPNDDVTAGVTGNETDAAYTQTYLLVNAAGNVVDVSTTGSFTLTSCTEIYTIYSYNYLTAGSSPTNPATIASIDCVANCCDVEAGAFTVSAQDTELPVFTSPPASTTVDCDAVPTMDDLTWTDNCSGTGTVPGLEVGTVDPCGYTLMRTWTYTDDCNNPVIHTQTITVNPAPQAIFPISPPDVTVDCSAIPNPLPSIIYTNGESGDCVISGTATATQTGTFDECGGSLVFTYTFTDDCDRTITESQDVTVNPAPEATFSTPPTNTSVDCSSIPPLADLSYSNGESGSCIIEGTVLATEMSDGNTCPETLTRTWTFTDDCSRTITTFQTIQVTDIEMPVFDTPPTAAVEPCGGSAPAMTMLMWTDNCDGTGLVAGTDVSDGGIPEIITRTWTYTDNCNNTATETQTITINEFTIDQALAGLCDDNGTLSDASDDLFSVTVDASIAASGVSNSFTVSDGTTTYGPFTYGTGGGAISGLPADGSTITLTFTDSDDAACTETATVSQASCSTSCALTIEDSTSNPCNANGTPSDASDDTFTVSVDASAINGSTEFTVTDGTTVWGPFTYGIGGTITLPADGSTISLSYIDNIDTGCAAQTTVSQASCSDLCALTIEQTLAGLCDDNGTLSDASDDTFDVTVDASVLNGGGTYTVSDGTTTYGPFTYGTAGTISGLSADGSTITLTYIDGNDGTCTAMTTISQASCSTSCALTIEDSTSSPCNANGTPSDASDDTFTVSVDASAINGSTEFTVTDGTTVWGPFTYGIGGMITLPADGSTITLIYTDNIDTGCAAQTTVSQASCSDLCALTIEQTLAGLCDDNGTLSDASDDTFDVTVDASVLNGGGTYTVSDGTTTYGPFTYGTAATISGLSADGSTITLTYIDGNDGTCTAMTTISQASCSTSCALTIGDSTSSPCNANGTLSDASDDTFTVSVDASAINGSTEFTVTDGTTVWGPFTYGIGGMITLPADGSTITLIYTDNIDAGCAAQTTVSQASCSDVCVLSINNASESPCDDNGTSTDTSDDTYFVTVNASVLNGGTTYTVSDGTNTYGPFTYGNASNVIDLPADGSIITLTFTDDSDTNCTAITTVSQSSCSSTCALTIDDSTAGVCDDNGTASDASDDIFDVTVNASAVNGGTEFNVTDGTTIWGPFTYGTGGTLTGLSANGANVTLTFSDVDTPSCAAQTTVGQVSCSDLCAFTIDQALAGLCSDNGTPTDNTDDTFDVTVDASALNGGGTYTVFDGTTTYGPFTYGTAGNITGLSADGSTITLTYIDATDVTCTAITTVSQSSCSSTCALTIDDSTAGVCDDNGTASDASDDIFDVTVNASAVNGGTEFNVTDGTTIWGPFTYGTGGTLIGLSANGANVTLTFSDVDTPSCAAQTTVGQVSCSDLCAFTIDQALAGLCSDNGTPTDNTDDTFDVTVDASALNGGGTYTVFDGTTTYGPFTYGTAGNITGLSADGSTITLTYIDATDVTCTAITTVSQSSCSSTCALTIDDSTAGVCDDNGTASDASDDIFDVSVDASAVNGGTEFMVTDGITIWGPFTYGIGGMLTGLSANGNNIILIFSDVDTPTCATQTTVSQSSCSDLCVLTIDQALAGLCNDNGTPSDATDDFLDVSIAATALNGSGTGYSVSDGTTIYGPFAYGIPHSIFGLPADGTNITLIFTDEDATACSQTTVVTQGSCSSQCEITITQETINPCNDNGTPSDATDDIFDVTVNAISLNGAASFSVTDGILIWGPFNYGTGGLVTGLAANGNNVSLTFLDDNDNTCNATTTVSQVSCSDQCALTIENATIGLCDNGGTLSDPSDDTYSVTVDASALNGAGSFEVTSGANVWGPFAYGTGGQVTGLIADGSNIVLTFIDIGDFNCFSTVTVSQVSCSTNCVLTVEDVLTGVCDDNGTPSDATDDTFEVFVDASALNGGTGFNVIADGTTYGPFTYGLGGVIPNLSADGTDVILTFTDVDDGGCSNQTVVNQGSCSDLCALDIQQATVGICDNTGTPTDPSDDTFNVTINANALNGGTTYTVSVGANNYGPFTYGVNELIVGLPADGSNLVLNFIDSNDVTCTDFVIVSQTSCSNNCELTITEETIGVCNDNGTPTDPSDDTFEMTVSASSQNGGENYSITSVTDSWGPFPYGVSQNITGLPAGGFGVVLTFSDMNDNTCAAQTNAFSPTCSNDCVLTIDQTVINLCNDAGTPSDATDDFFDVFIQASIVNGSSNFTITEGANTYGPFPYSEIGSVFSLPADGSNITLTIADVDDPNCNATTIVSQGSCSDLCQLEVSSFFIEDCNDNSTPTDASDDYFNATIDVTIFNGADNFTITNGTITWGPFSVVNGMGTGVATNLPTTGAGIILFIFDGDNGSCAAQVEVSQTSCSNDCALTIEQSLIGLCENNGTLSDSTDDTYDVTVNASALNGATDFIVSDGTTTYGPFSYATGGIIPNLSADGSIITLTFTDADDANCTATTTVSQASCSTNCELTIDELTAGACNDNGTPSDATDDIFEVTVNASSINGGTDFNVTDGTTTWGPFTYGTVGLIPNLPANGNNIVLTFTDADNSGCANQGTISQSSCSDLCAMTIGQTIIGLCDNNGTLSDSTDDTYDVTVNASSLNGATDFIVSDGTTTYGPFAYATGGVIPNLPADGSTITLTFIDADNANCTAMTTVSQASCSTSCILTIDETTPQACNDNGTPSDPTDDFFDITINASSVNGNGQYVITDGINIWGPFDYGIPGLVTGCPATGADFILTVSDVLDAGCAAQTTVNQGSCSNACALSITNVVESICDDNGTPIDATDDTYSVTVNANTLNGGINFNVTDGTTIWGPFAYGIGGIIPDLPANGSTINLVLSDESDATCNANITVSQESCSSDCQLIIDEVTTGDCNDNGTPSDSLDDIFEVTVNASSINGGTAYTVTDGILIWGPFDYGVAVIIPDYPANGANIVLTFIDVENNDCTNQETVSQASCSDLCALTIDQTVIGLCDNNGTLSDSSDDTYSVTVNASAVNGSMNFNVSDGTTTYGPFLYGIGGIISDLPADNSNIILTFIDENDATCTASITVNQVSCSTDCVLTIGGVLPQICNDNGTPSDPTDDIFDVLINASAVNGNGQYEVTDGTNVWGPFNYFNPGLLTGLSATGTDIVLTVTDAIDGGCAAQTTVNQAPCSDLCVLNILAATESTCDDNGTNTDVTDDTYSVTINAESVNGGTEFFVTDGTIDWGPFLYGIGGELTNLPANGTIINLSFFDSDDNTCLAQTTVTQTSCSLTCTLSIDSSIIGDCDDNGTGADNTDDTFSVTINASSVSGTATYSVFDGTNNYGPFNYNTDEVIAGLPANGMNMTLFLTDTNDANCNAQIEVSQNPCSNCNLTAEAGNIQTISCGTPTVTLTGMSNETGVNYEWTGPTGFPMQTTTSVTTNISGTYFLEVTNPNTGCIATSEVEVNENPDLPSVSITIDGEITCEENSTVLLTANTAVTNSEFIWTTPDGMTFTTQTIEVSSAGEYSVIVADLDANCDSAPAVATVVENTIPPIAIIQDVMDELNCVTIAGGILLGSNGSSVGDTITYQWLLEDEILGEDATITIFQGGEYVLIVTNILTNCTDAAFINIAENIQFPIAAAGLDGEINCYFNEVTLDGSNSTNLPTITYGWEGPVGGFISGELTSVAIVDESGMYVLTVTETESFCTNTDTVFVSQNTQVPGANIAGGFDLDCITESGTLTGEGSTTGSNISYQWSNTSGEITGATNFNLEVENSDTYSLFVFDAENGCSNIATETIEELEVDIQLTTILDDPDCFEDENGIILIDIITGANPPFLVSINGGDLSTTNAFLGLPGGTYTITVEDALGCTTTQEDTLETPKEIFIDLGENQIIELGETVEIPVLTSVDIASIDVLLLNADTLYNCNDCDIEVQPLETTEYLGTLIDENGCTTTDIMSVFVRKGAEIFVPNIFSPDNNDINDSVFPFASDGVVLIKQFLIFDRWGETVHSYYDFPPNQPDFGWDGNFNGKKMNPGVFVWYIEAEMLDGRVVVVKGDITLFR